MVNGSRLSQLKCNWPAVLRLRSQRGNPIQHKMITSLVTVCPSSELFQYYRLTPHPVRFIPGTHLLWNWNFVPLNFTLSLVCLTLSDLPNLVLSVVTSRSFHVAADGIIFIDIRNTGLISGSRRSPGGGNGNSLQYFCLGNPWTEEPGGLQTMGSQSWTWHTAHLMIHLAFRFLL